ncbi:hypothetical protein B0H14DRAFT_2753135 [Mycena olivaceomarginata]|nr:hypothetical protein B0H14DRAFT_2753135 [Mycena olivaceomarginata]
MSMALRTSRPDSSPSMSTPGFSSSLPLPRISASASKPRPALCRLARPKSRGGSAVPLLVSSCGCASRAPSPGMPLEHPSSDIKYTFVSRGSEFFDVTFVLIRQFLSFFRGGGRSDEMPRPQGRGGVGATYRFSGNSFSSRNHDRPCISSPVIRSPGQGRTARNNGRGGKRRCLFSSRARASSADIMNVH